MYDLPALVEHVCQETGYDKVNPIPFPHLSLSLLISLVDRIHRPLSRKWTRVHLTLTRHVPVARQETIMFHSPSTGRLCWAPDHWLPVHRIEQDRMEYLEEILWRFGLYSPHALGV